MNQVHSSDSHASACSWFAGWYRKPPGPIGLAVAREPVSSQCFIVPWITTS